MGKSGPGRMFWAPCIILPAAGRMLLDDPFCDLTKTLIETTEKRKYSFGNYCLTQPTAQKRIDWLATAATLGTLLCWSTGPPCIRFLSGQIDSWTQNGLRYGVASAFWLPYLLLCLRRVHFDHQVWRRALIPAGFNVIMQSCWARSVYYIDPGFMSLLSKSSIIWVVISSMVLFADERRLLHSRSLWAGMILCVAGVVGVIVSRGDFAAGATTKGIALVLAAALMWAMYTISVRIAFRHTDVRIGFSVIAIYTTAALMVLALCFGRPGQCLQMNKAGWSVLVVSGVMAIGIAHVMYYFAINRIGATIPSLLQLASPLMVLAISRVWFGEVLNSWQYVFGLLLLAGAALAVKAQQHLGPVKLDSKC